jgi:hypothetical protein
MKIERVHELTQGITIGNMAVSTSNVYKARYQEEMNFDLQIQTEDVVQHLLSVSLFRGRPPYYHAWVELYDINSSIKQHGYELKYYGSWLEKELIAYFARILEKGDRIFVEYHGDKETRRLLMDGTPPALTRLGFLMLLNDLTWFKDWYFPEGFMEGGQKLQGEKALDNRAYERHMQSIEQEIKAFLNTRNGDQAYYTLVYNRAQHILEKHIKK